jgi:arginase family enzyme
MQDLTDFLEPVDLREVSMDTAFTDGQLAKHIHVYDGELPDTETADLVLVGIQESRGSGDPDAALGAADLIRKHLYRMHYWHDEVALADIGNIKPGATIQDSYAAIRTVVTELMSMGKTVILLGGSHDITLAQYGSYRDLEIVVEATCIDARIDLRGESNLRSDNFLLEMLTGEPSLVKHYNHIGFQSYFVHPRLLETMDRLHFDCFRVGKVRENMDNMEPVLRQTNLLSIDISAIKNSEAPANTETPNGLAGDEACMLARFAGMSPRMRSIGFYGYDPRKDRDELTAIQIAQMIWYYLDGRQKVKTEGNLDERDNFIEYHTTIGEVETVFLQNKKTQRWWMQLPDKQFIPCGHSDYIEASRNIMPERWLRAQEKS